MKKQLIMMACMLMASIAAFAGTNSKILLQHEGGVKVYDSNQMTQALADAVKGDTLFLSEGTFAGFDLTKEVMIRGCGKTTIITGAVKIAIAGNPTFSSCAGPPRWRSRTAEAWGSWTAASAADPFGTFSTPPWFPETPRQTSAESPSRSSPARSRCHW